MLRLVVVIWLVIPLIVMAYEDVAEEARRLGATITNAVSYPHPFPDTGVGMVATRDIRPDESLFRFPIRACVSPLNLARQAPRVAPVLAKLDTANALTMTLLYELSLGNKSLHSVYLSRLDKTRVPLPRFWSQKELAQLQDASAMEWFSNQLTFTHRNYHRARHVLLEHGFGKRAQALTFAEFAWAEAIVQSRSFHGPHSTSTLIPFADLVNNRPHGYVGWFVIEDGDDDDLRYEFKTLPGEPLPAGGQLFYHYGGGDDNLHLLGAYGYVPFPNEDNQEPLLVSEAMVVGGVDSATAAWQQAERYSQSEPAKLGDGVWLTARVSKRQLMRFFRTMVAPALGRRGRFSVRVETRAARRCVEVLRRKLASRRTTVAQDYALLHQATDSNLRTALMYRIDSKSLLMRNLYVCERLFTVVLPRLRVMSTPQCHALRRWAKYVAALVD